MTFEIFKTGEHTSNNGNTKVYTEKDLDDLVNSYNPKELEAPVVVGHPKDNSPAYGWIESIKRIGDRLVAKAKDIVPEFSEAVKKGLYKKRSISITPDGKLRHVGFLGGAIPAVKGLADISFSTQSQFIYELELPSVDFDEEALVASPPEKTDEVTKPDINSDSPSFDNQKFSETLNQIQVMLKDLSDNFMSMDPALDNSELQRVNSRIDDLRFKVNLSEFQILLNEKISNGSLTPAMKSKIISLLNYLDAQNFTSEFDFSAFKKDFNSLLVDFVNSIPKIISFEDFAEKPLALSKNDNEDYAGFPVDEYSSAVHNKALVLMKSENIPYLDAVKRMSAN